LTREEQLQEIERLLDKSESKISSAFQQGIDEIQDKIVLAEIQRALESGNVQEVTTLINQTLVGQSFIEFNRSLQDAYIRGGRFSERLARTNKIVFAFDVTDAGPSAFMRGYKADKIQQITREAQVTVQQIVRRETVKGTNPIKTARMIRNNIGLTASQEQAVRNYRSYLDDLQGEALRRDLRDKRFDPTVRRAIKEGKPLTEAQKDVMEERYRQRYLKRRSQNIARTEAIRLNSAGQDQYWKQAAKEGAVDADKIKRKWIVTRDSRLRDAHAAIPNMNPDGVGLNEPFRSPLGPIHYPGDPTASAANTIQCRCNVITRIQA
jgi:hypothetical protein